MSLLSIIKFILDRNWVKSRLQINLFLLRTCPSEPPRPRWATDPFIWLPQNYGVIFPFLLEKSIL